MFYTFGQNNTGGSFYQDENIGKNTIIEAENEEDAIEKALSLGIYFDGVYKGIDCGCCGDRWYPARDVTETPEIYGQTVEEYIDGKYYGNCCENEKVHIHYLDGRHEILGRVQT